MLVHCCYWYNNFAGVNRLYGVSYWIWCARSIFIYSYIYLRKEVPYSLPCFSFEFELSWVFILYYIMCVRVHSIYLTCFMALSVMSFSSIIHKYSATVHECVGGKRALCDCQNINRLQLQEWLALPTSWDEIKPEMKEIWFEKWQIGSIK